MGRVCQKQFPETDGFHLDGYLQEYLDILATKVAYDFDWVILVSGRGMVRVGKSVLGGHQVGCYLTHKVNELHGTKNTFTQDNFVFRGDELIKIAKTMPPYSVIVYDEAGSDLMARKTMHSTTQALLDFFREAGQLNLFLICILPDFFELPKHIALTRSVCLIDVDFREKFNRGKFRFYGRKNKKFLYLKGKKYLDYDSQGPDFQGSFVNFFTVDREAYKQKKMDALMGREKQASERITARDKRLSEHRRILSRWIYEELKIPQVEIANRLRLSQPEVS